MTISKRNESLVDTFLGRRKQVVVIVDPYSTGCLVAQEIAKRGYLLICVYTDALTDVMKGHVPLSVGQMQYFAVVDQDVGMTVNDVAKEVQDACGKYELVSVIAGGDRGVDFADALSECLGLMTNGTDIPNRRDKKIQQELAKAAGLRAVRQAGGTEFHQVEAFLRKEPYPVVLKPIESSGSDGVKLCYTFEEAKEHFELVMSSPMVDGGPNTGCLAQEFLRGKEYIVDHVSRNGVHKTMMVWVYDKRPANGANFCYFGCIPIDSKSHEAKVLIPYCRSVLDAMGVKHGASHAEIIITADGPCLVEMNCRCNGGDGIWRPLCRALTGGYTQVEACADAYLDEAAFQKYPDKPPSPFKAAGQEIELVSYARGTVRSTPGYDMISQLPSFVHLESAIKKGSKVEYTIDLDTCIGTVCLMHPSQAVVEADVRFIRYMEEINGIFQFEPVMENLKRPRGEAIVQKSVSIKPPHRRVFSSDDSSRGLIRKISQTRNLGRGSFKPIDQPKEVIVMVDPYSTGSCIALEFMQRGYKVLALWTTGFPLEMRKYVPMAVSSQGKLEFFDQIEEGKTLEDTIQSLQECVTGSLRISSILPGDEAGVDLVDALTEKLKLRTNGTKYAKRDKKLQQEVLEKFGLSSMRQAGGSDFSEISFFLKQEPYPIVLKPSKSAPGSDGGVKLCHKFEDAKEHFQFLMTSQTVANALEVPAVLAQEFLRGKEYVVDHVSRDGVHKTMMIWYNDKRPANGANNSVYFGAVPVDPTSPEASILIPYVRMALSAMGVMHGPSSTEVILAIDGPCLVKMSCSAHKGDGNWVSLCRALTGGYSQVDATVEAYAEDGKSQWSTIPNTPPSPFRASGLEVLLVSFSRGVVKATPGFDIIQNLPSFVSMETGITVGSTVEYTTDLFTGVGSVMLMHYDSEVLARDVEQIRDMETNNKLFEYDRSEINTLLKSGSASNIVGIAAPVVISADRPDLF